MLIRHIILGGLRSYGPDPTTVPLGPLTLVFGQNSAGKSSLLSVLPILQQTAAHPGVLTMSGDVVEGGTFRMAVHRHDESVPMTLGLGWTAADGSLHQGSGVFVWDPETAQAVRTVLKVDDGTTATAVTGARPWRGQPGAAVAESLAPELFEILSRVYFLGPMRARAERTTSVGQAAGEYVGPVGERMAELLFTRPDLLAHLNRWCDRLGLGYRVRMLTPLSQDIIMSAGDFTVLALEDIRHDPPVLVSPRAVGYGVGQMLPVMTQCLIDSDGLIIVEQPEVHLHPRLQSAVADLFVDTVNARRSQLLIETHSEHLVLRLLRRVREGVLGTQDLTLLYIDLDEDGAAFVRTLAVDDDGELVDGWPGGFFDERLAEVLPGLGGGR
jgi:hypothetical protein